jgi:hypothetical protein
MIARNTTTTEQSVTEVPKRPRGRPALTGKAGKRFMIHLPPKTATMLRAVGSGSISLGVIRLANTHEGQIIVADGPPARTVKQIKATARARARAQKALDVVNEMLKEKITGET